MGGVAVALQIMRYVAVAADPLACVPDEPKRRVDAGQLELLGWILTATVLVAGSSYWMGIQSMRQEPGSNLRPNTVPKTPALLPQPSMPQTSPLEVNEERPSSSAPIAAARIPVIAPATSKQNATSKRESLPANEQVKDAKPTAAIDAATVGKRGESGEHTAAPDGIWPVQTVEGASGRLVRIGHFATAAEAEKGWETVLREYPGMRRLKSLPVSIKSLRDGHIYYRLQVGTTSQAHSDVVCERMRDMDQSCTVIGSDEASKDSAT